MTEIIRRKGDGEQLAIALRELNELSAQVGWFDSAKYTDETQVAYIAAIQEYGYEPKNIPPRMGLRAMFPGKKESWVNFLRIACKKCINGKMSATAVMEAIGGRAEGDIRKQIASVTEPPLTFATQAARARRLGIPADELTATGAKPLNDTGLMIASVTHKVAPAGADEQGALPL